MIRPCGHHDDPVGDVADHVHVVLDEEHRHAVLAQVLDVPEQALGQRRVHPGHRLVEHDHLGLAHQRPGHLQQLALAAGQAAGEVVALGVELEPGEQVVGPLGDLAAPGRRQMPRNSAAKTFSPLWPVAPSRMFSITVSLDSALVSWKVRTMPSRATLCAATPLRRRAVEATSCPSSGWSKPVSRLKNVVLPAPFGPISAVIAPRWISRCSTSTAVRPPKWRVMSSATRIGSGFGARAVRDVARAATPRPRPRRLPASATAVAAGRRRGLVSGHRARSPSGRRRCPAAGRSSAA